MKKQTYIPNICSIFWQKTVDIRMYVRYYIVTKKTYVRNTCSYNIGEDHEREKYT